MANIILSKKAWAEGEPNGLPGESYTQMDWGKNYFWNDAGSVDTYAAKSFAICQLHADATTCGGEGSGCQCNEWGSQNITYHDDQSCTCHCDCKVEGTLCDQCKVVYFGLSSSVSECHGNVW